MKRINVNNLDLTRDKVKTFLSGDVVATGSTIRVQSILGFEGVGTSSGQIVCIGQIGDDKTELLRSSNSSGYNPSQAYKEITLRDAMVFDHPQDTPVYIIDWNRVQVQWASSVAGTKQTLTAYPRAIDAGQSESIFKDTSQTTGFYFVRFNETIGDTYSDYSDAVPYSGYNDNMVFAIKQRALDEIGELIDGNIITHEFINQCLWEARREYHQSPGKRPFRRNFNAIIGNVLTGSFRIELPADTEKPHTAENVFGVRVGGNLNMRYYDKKEWDFDYVGRAHTSLAYPYTAGTSTSVWLSNGRDFSASASIVVEGQTIGLTRVEGYTGDSFYNSFRIYSHPSGAWNASAGSDVWENQTFGLPDRFTVWADPGGSAYIYFNRPFDTAYAGLNIYADYYRTLLGYDSDADTLDEPKYDMFVSFLKAKIKERRSKGTLDITKDHDYLLWLAKKQEALGSEVIETDIRMSPDVFPFGYGTHL